MFEIDVCLSWSVVKYLKTKLFKYIGQVIHFGRLFNNIMFHYSTSFQISINGIMYIVKNLFSKLKLKVYCKIFFLSFYNVLLKLFSSKSIWTEVIGLIKCVMKIFIPNMFQVKHTILQSAEYNTRGITWSSIHLECNNEICRLKGSNRQTNTHRYN